jgi:formate hydrogenlyase transcriptional activator
MQNVSSLVESPAVRELVGTPAADRPAILLAVAQAVAAHADVRDLFRNLASALQPHLCVDYLSFSLVDPSTRTAQFQFLQTIGTARPPDPADTPVQLPASESPTATVWETQAPFWLTITGSDTRYPTLSAALHRQRVRGAGFVPLTTVRRRLGAMAFSTYREVLLREGDLDFLAQIGRLVALAVEATLTRRELEQANDRLIHERDRLEMLLRIGEAVSSRLDLPGLVRAVADGLRRLVNQDLTTLWLPEPDGRHLRAAALELMGDEQLLTEDMVVRIDESPSGEAYVGGQTVRLGPVEMSRLTTAVARWLIGRGAEAYCAVPLRVGTAVVAVLSMIARQTDAFNDDVVSLLEEAARPVGVAVANALAYRRIEGLTARLSQEKRYLEEEIRTEGGFGEIIGSSPALHEVLGQVEVVAPTDSAVLITGETGTGKELIARAVHRLSKRRQRTFVKLNCAAIPSGLLESELFGHE